MNVRSTAIAAANSSHRQTKSATYVVFGAQPSSSRATGSKKLVANKAAVTTLIKRIALLHMPSAYIIATQ